MSVGHLRQGNSQAKFLHCSDDISCLQVNLIRVVRSQFYSFQTCKHRTTPLYSVAILVQNYLFLLRNNICGFVHMQTSPRCSPRGGHKSKEQGTVYADAPEVRSHSSASDIVEEPRERLSADAPEVPTHSSVSEIVREPKGLPHEWDSRCWAFNCTFTGIPEQLHKCSKCKIALGSAK